ncbi:MAG: nucleotidyltransferase domain-containing protein [Chloroflexi bacterium]|nr:nucleotidyltransferase domain-containing protein [Chloroflexota bacterium]
MTVRATNSPVDYYQERRQRAEAIINILKLGLELAVSRFPVEIAYLHGSVARGTPLSDSDVDLALVLNESLPPMEQLQLEFEIQDAIVEACKLKAIDVRVINRAPLSVQGEIVQEGKCLYVRNREFKADFESLTRRKYFDFKPNMERMQKAFLQHIRRRGLSHG